MPRAASLYIYCVPFRPAFPAIVAALEYIIVDTAILDIHGRKLWKDYFLKKVTCFLTINIIERSFKPGESANWAGFLFRWQDKVSWTEFLKVYVNLLPPQDDPQTRILNFKCLYALLGMPPFSNKTENPNTFIKLISFPQFRS